MQKEIQLLNQIQHLIPSNYYTNLKQSIIRKSSHLRKDYYRIRDHIETFHPHNDNAYEIALDLEESLNL